MRTDANGIKINYEIDGPDGAPWVTFITGITNDTTMWDDHVTALSQNYRLLRLDSRGHGGSDTTPGPYSFDQLPGDVVGVWDALGVEKSHVVGIGLGGMTTAVLALSHPPPLPHLLVGIPLGGVATLNLKTGRRLMRPVTPEPSDEGAERRATTA